MSKLIFATFLSISSLLAIGPVAAQNDTRIQVQMIEEEYSSQNNGEMIPDDQLEYYLDQSNAGWSMNQINQDIANSQNQTSNYPWRPQTGWVAQEVICTSQNSQYRECPAPFNGTAIITQQISQSSCIQGQSWGQRPGVIWVNRGCRARFGIVPASSGNHPYYPSTRQYISCQSSHNKYHQCYTGFRGRVQLVKRLNYSAACISGRTWGQREGMVWVSRGCRAQFASVIHNNEVYGNGSNWDSNYGVTCSSNNDAQARCNWDSRYGHPRLGQQISGNACIEGRTWGYDESNNIWVSNGCRARFVSSRTSFGQNDVPYNNNGNAGNNWVRDNNYAQTCSSNNGAMTSCSWDVRYGSPHLLQQLSSQACVSGQTWGYDNNRGLWVNSGCRGVFGL